MEEMSVQILGAFFDSMYESMFREEHNVMRTLAYAYQDALAGTRGKAKEYQILLNDANDDKLIAFIQGKKSFCILPEGQEEDAMYLRNFFTKYNDSIQEVSQEKAEVVFRLCPYIFQMQEFDLSGKEIMIDSERNCVLTEDDALIVKNYQYSKMLYIYMNQDVFLATAKGMRK